MTKMTVLGGMITDTVVINIGVTSEGEIGFSYHSPDTNVLMSMGVREAEAMIAALQSAIIVLEKVEKGELELPKDD